VVAAASVVCNVALNVVLIPRYGIDGAAWASTASYSLLFVATAAVYRRLTHVPLRELLVLSREDGARYMRLGRRITGRPVAASPIAPDVAWPQGEESVASDAGPRGPQ
jgi:Na+-driven multidrug efflux pump